LNKQALQVGLIKEVNDLRYADTTGCAWENKDTLISKLFDQEKFKRPIQVKYFDLPELHLNTEIG
jgi:hypothetical protein